MLLHFRAHSVSSGRDRPGSSAQSLVELNKAFLAHRQKLHWPVGFLFQAQPYGQDDFRHPTQSRATSASQGTANSAGAFASPSKRNAQEGDCLEEADR